MVSSRDPHSKDVGDLQLGDKKVTAAESPGPQMDVSENRGTPKSSILIRFSIINHPFWGTLIFGNTQMFAQFLPSFLPCQSKVSDAEQQRLAKASVFFVFSFSGTCSPTIEVLSKKKRLKPAKGIDWRIIFEILTPHKSKIDIFKRRHLFQFWPERVWNTCFLILQKQVYETPITNRLIYVLLSLYRSTCTSHNKNLVNNFA